MQLNQRGDTIVEVLIAIAVVSAVLGSAYALTNRNVKNSQQAQEHSQALKVAESQLEQLKVYANTRGLPTDSTFCIYNNTIKTAPTTNTDCKIDDGNATDRYTAVITRNTDTFTVKVEWDGINGGKDQVSLAYKVF